MVLRHLILTRFNLATAGREQAHRARAGWLEERFALFERFCLPAVAAQDCQAFDWIIYFDDGTPGWARERIARLRTVRDFHPCFTPLFDATGWARTARAVIGPPLAGRMLVTSNLDNDDALASDYVSRVQAAARTGIAGGRFAINLADGLVISGGALYRHHHPSNAFTNLVEPDDDGFATTMTIRHMELASHVPVVQAPGPAAWLQVVHGGNVSNRIRGRRIRPAEAGGRFPPGALEGLAQPGAATLLADAVLRAPLRRLRDAAFAAARRVIRVDA